MTPPTPCREPGCELPKHKPYHRCFWHWLKVQPIGDQIIFRDRRAGMVPPALKLARVPSRLWPPGTRFCSGCQSFIPDFYASGSRCKACASAASHSAMVKKTYGIEGDEYTRLLALQSGRCAICRNKPKSKRLAVDHSHATGAVRGLLCKSCNKGILGSAHDSLNMLMAAVAYLDTPPTSGLWRAPEEQAVAEAVRTKRLVDPGQYDRPGKTEIVTPGRTVTAGELVALGGGVDESGKFYRVYGRPDGPPPF